MRVDQKTRIHENRRRDDLARWILLNRRHGGGLVGDSGLDGGGPRIGRLNRVEDWNGH